MVRVCRRRRGAYWTGQVVSLVEMLGGVERPVGVAEELACEENDVSLTGADDLVGLFGRGDHAYGAGWDRGFAANGF